MKRLLVKELLEVRRFAVAILALAAALLLLRDPLTFVPVTFSASDWFLLALFPALLMGLSAYARENGAETLPFLFSRPARWWQVLLAKVLAGLAGCAAVAIIAALLYALTVPSLYRPFLTTDLLFQGTVKLAVAFALAFGLGLSFSVVAPSTAASLPLFVVTATVLASAMDRIYWRESWEAWLALGLLVAVIVSLVPPGSLDRWTRILRWCGVMTVVVALLALAGLGYRVSGVAPVPPRENAGIASPDRSTLASLPNAWSQQEGGGYTDLTAPVRRNREVWVRGRGFTRRIDTAPRAGFVAWRPDSQEFLYMAQAGRQVELRAAGAASGWRPRTVAVLPRLPYVEGSALYLNAAALHDVLWSPDRSAVALRVMVFSRISSGSPLVLLNLRNGRSRLVLDVKDWAPFWWVDNTRLAVQNADGVSVIPLTPVRPSPKPATRSVR